jgi:hypothetical protein
VRYFPGHSFGSSSLLRAAVEWGTSRQNAAARRNDRSVTRRSRASGFDSARVVPELRLGVCFSSVRCRWLSTRRLWIVCFVQFEARAYLAGKSYIHSANDAEGSHNGSAAVLKTAGRKAMQVRVLSPPPFLINKLPPFMSLPIAPGN